MGFLDNLTSGFHSATGGIFQRKAASTPAVTAASAPADVPEPPMATGELTTGGRRRRHHRKTRKGGKKHHRKTRRHH
jgi:hypothetical protein